MFSLIDVALENQQKKKKSNKEEAKSTMSLLS